MSDDPYSVLGVSRDASDKDIKAAYRKLAKSLHPDLNPGDKEAEARFKAVSAAYNLLGDKEKRARFDRGELDASGAEAPQNPFYRQYAGGDAQHHYYSNRGFSDFGDESDFFSDLFRQASEGRHRHDGRTHRGRDVRYHLAIDFIDAALGVKRRVSMPDGITLDITIPAGVSEGQTLRLKGKGMPGHSGGNPGDAYVTLEIAAHPLFRRQGQDIYLDLPITIDEAVLGGKVTVPTIHGNVSVPVPAASSTGRTLRLKGKGIKGGHQFITLKVMLPDTVDDELKDFMTRWRDKHPYDVRQDMETGA
ncbi:DnaJ C-terminal domain-containing protein [Kordiimonas gwangyangensis]|uniref:DnaJ C-terminal domain-containing protein n=1 Tax=Kordiimonas gwangyangensis TaxID=288022 RepID=UPI00036A845D|nr:DnaJ C-terminal domain-containing protein [Kordiimonas gwangyangensis]